MAILQSSVNTVKISSIHSDEKLGTFWALGTEKEWIEIRSTMARYPITTTYTTKTTINQITVLKT